MKYNIKIIENVLSEYEKNKNISHISKIFDIPRATIKYWINSNILNSIKIREDIDRESIGSVYEHISLNKKDYSFILGLYLGDGCITENGRNNSSYKLRIAQDNKYPNVISIIQNSLSNFFGKDSKLINGKGCTHITIYDKYLPIYFPQHGKGFKHDRKIKLNDFQSKNIDDVELLRGLWLSDGSFYIAKHGKYEYERYNFTNKSVDLIEIFGCLLDKLDVKYSKRIKRNGVWTIEVQNRKYVSILKDILGTKS